MWGNPQLLTLDWSWQCFPISHCLAWLITILVSIFFTDTHSSLCHDPMCFPRSLQQPHHWDWHCSWLDWRGDQWAWAKGWSELQLATSTVSLLLVLGWTPLSDSGWTGGGLHQLLKLASVVLPWDVLPPWSSGVLSRELARFTSLELRMSTRVGSLTWVPEAWTSDTGRTREGGVLSWCACLLIGAKVWEPINSRGVSSAKALAPSYMAVVSTSPTEHVGTAKGLSAVKRNHVRSLIELAGLTCRRTSLNVLSNYSYIPAHRFSCLWSSSHLSWVLAWVTACNCLRAAPKSSASVVCVPLSLLAQEECGGTESGTREEKWWSSTEISHRSSLVNRMILSLSPFFLGQDDLSRGV